MRLTNVLIWFFALVLATVPRNLSTMTFSASPTGSTKLVETDAPAYQHYFVDCKVIRQLAASVPWAYPDDGVVNYIRSDIIPEQGRERWVWAITRKENPSELIGAIELMRKATPTNRGFWLGSPSWGRGYMTEAVKPSTHYAFRKLGFEKLIFVNAVGNRRSARMKDKSGARLIRREAASYVDPSLTERELYELLKDDCLKFSGATKGEQRSKGIGDHPLLDGFTKRG